MVIRQPRMNRQALSSVPFLVTGHALISPESPTSLLSATASCEPNAHSNFSGYDGDQQKLTLIIISAFQTPYEFISQLLPSTTSWRLHRLAAFSVLSLAKHVNPTASRFVSRRLCKWISAYISDARQTCSARYVPPSASYIVYRLVSECGNLTPRPVFEFQCELVCNIRKSLDSFAPSTFESDVEHLS